MAEPLEVQHIGTAAEREQRVLEAIDTSGLRPAADFAFRYPHELSGGQRQRVVIAGALVLDPAIVVADEPVSMLDVSIRTEILNLMLDLRRQRDLTYLFITHDLSVAWVIADRIAVMYLGKIMELGTSQEVINDPRHPYTRALVSVMPTPEPPKPGLRARRVILAGETPDAVNIPPGCRFHPRCPLAEQAGIMARCRTEEPPLIDLGAGRSSACWLAESGKPLPAVERRVGGSELGDVAPVAAQLARARACCPTDRALPGCRTAVHAGSPERIRHGPAPANPTGRNARDLADSGAGPVAGAPTPPCRCAGATIPRRGPSVDGPACENRVQYRIRRGGAREPEKENH